MYGQQLLYSRLKIGRKLYKAVRYLLLSMERQLYFKNTLNSE